MITLDDKIWQSSEGGYRTEYDASIPLKQLEITNDPRETEIIFDELWNELHHQGDVGLASYLALPQLVRIAIQKNMFDRRVIDLCAVIEQQRYVARNPPLPEQYQQYYSQGLADLKSFVLANLHRQLDESTFNAACSALATASGYVKLGKAILNLDDESTLDEFLEQY